MSPLKLRYLPRAAPLAGLLLATAIYGGCTDEDRESLTYRDVYQLEAPRLEVSGISTTRLQLHWQRIPLADRYVIQVSVTRDDWSVDADIILEASSFPDSVEWLDAVTGALGPMPHYLRMRAERDAEFGDQRSSWSRVQMIIPGDEVPPLPVVPTEVHDIDGDTWFLRWGTPEFREVERYEIRYSNGPTNWDDMIPLPTVAPPVLSSTSWILDDSRLFAGVSLVSAISVIGVATVDAAGNMSTPVMFVPPFEVFRGRVFGTSEIQGESCQGVIGNRWGKKYLACSDQMIDLSQSIATTVCQHSPVGDVVSILDMQGNTEAAYDYWIPVGQLAARMFLPPYRQTEISCLDEEVVVPGSWSGSRMIDSYQCIAFMQGDPSPANSDSLIVHTHARETGELLARTKVDLTGVRDFVAGIGGQWFSFIGAAARSDGSFAALWNIDVSSSNEDFALLLTTVDGYPAYYRIGVWAQSVRWSWASSALIYGTRRVAGQQINGIWRAFPPDRFDDDLGDYLDLSFVELDPALATEIHRDASLGYGEFAGKGFLLLPVSPATMTLLEFVADRNGLGVKP